MDELDDVVIEDYCKWPRCADSTVLAELRALLPKAELAPAQRNLWVYNRLTARLNELEGASHGQG